MARGYIPVGSGGNGTSDDCTATLDKVVEGFTAITSDSGDEPAEGTLPNRGSYQITEAVQDAPHANEVRVRFAYGAFFEETTSGHEGESPYIRAPYNYVASAIGLTAAKMAQGQTALGLTGTYKGLGDAAVGHVLKGKKFSTASLSNATGTLEIQSAISFSAAARSQSVIRISWKNPSKGPWEGIFVQISTTGFPGTSGGTRKYTGPGVNGNQAGGDNYVDITGLEPGTTYYFTCCSYCDGIGWGTNYNVSAKTNNANYTLGQLVNNDYFSAGYFGLFNAYGPDNDDDNNWLVIPVDTSNNPNGYGENAIYKNEHSSPTGVAFDYGGGTRISSFRILLFSDTEAKAKIVQQSISSRYEKVQFEQRSGDNFNTVNGTSRRDYQIHSVTYKGRPSASSYTLPVSASYNFPIGTSSTWGNLYMTEIILYSDTGSSSVIAPSLQKGGSSGYYPLLYFHN